MEGKKFFIGKIRDILRISTGFQSVSDVRIQGIHDLSLCHIIRGRKGTLHFIINNTVDLQVIFLIFQLIVPAFLTEDLLFLVDIRIKYGIEIDMNQILKICIIAARYRINCLIRIGHGIQEGIQGTLGKLNKGILHRKVLRTAKYGMLQDMGNPRAVLWRCPKSNIKYLVLIII